MSNLAKNEHGIIEIAKALGLKVKYAYEQRYQYIDIMKDTFDVEQDKPFSSLKIMLENAHVEFSVQDMSYYEGKMSIKIPCPIKIRKPFYHTKADSRPAVAETTKWSRAKIISLIDSQAVVLTHWKADILTTQLDGLQVGDYIIRKTWTYPHEVLPFHNILGALDDWAVPHKIVDDDVYSYIIIKAENLSD